MKTTILCVEDDSSIAELLTFTLDVAGFAHVHCSSAEQALESTRQSAPDLAIIDWMLPGLSGVALIKKLREARHTRDLPIILLTAKSQEEDKVQGLEHGADDYITKPFSPKELVARVRALIRRRSPQLAGEPVEYLGVRAVPANYAASFADTTIELGVVEFRLLYFFITHPNRVLSRDQLLDQVWGGDTEVQDRTVDVYIRRVRAALEKAAAPDLIETIRGAGYRLAAGTTAS